MMESNEKLTLTIPEAARRLGISRNLAYDIARRGELPGLIRLGRKRMVVSKHMLTKLLETDDSALLASSSIEG
ncbi:MAG TPA: helix-turn-helix domain-containing protein [Dehalococcoidales bacterium]|nr:helix-turn-helix domain-containing protein [Dehalococcoidales bacterium]